MATKKNQRAGSTKEKMSARVRKAFLAGYKQGFEASAKNPNGGKFWSARGYGKGYGDKKKVQKIERRYNRSKNY